MKKYKNLLTSTTLIPLWAKAVESVSSDPILMDGNAYPLLKALGYDLNHYDKKKQNPSQVGCCLRAKWIDDRTLEFISSHPGCQVIQLGAGIDDRYRRIGMPQGVLHWYDLDLEEVATMRREVIPECGCSRIISMDMFNTAWMERMKENGLPSLIIIEGVLMYIPEEKIKELLEKISSCLGESVILLDSIPSFAVGRAKYHDSVKKYDKKVEYIWGVRNAEDLERLSSQVEVKEFVYMSDLPMARKFTPLLKLMYKIPFFYKNANQRLIQIKLGAETKTPEA